jgi:beta-glucanase (GH16 family)
LNVILCFPRSGGQDIVLPVMSARIRTLKSFGFRYGRVEVRAQLPRGDWLWPGMYQVIVTLNNNTQLIK